MPHATHLLDWGGKVAAALTQCATAWCQKKAIIRKNCTKQFAKNDINSIKSCLDNGADVNYVDTDFKVSVLYVACFESRQDILRMLIMNDVNLLRKR